MPELSSLLLLSPWADTSRSHSGPISAPNKLSTVYTNRETDIISNSLSFRNTAVSALLGNMEARETYKNPYLSSISLQLTQDKGGAGPSWGFEGFPKQVYICTGTAELSHDQHQTLAYRMAGGSRQRVPIVIGSQLGENVDPYEMAARLSYPRPSEHEISLWPSVQNTPEGSMHADTTSIAAKREGLEDEKGESPLMAANGHSVSLAAVNQRLVGNASNNVDSSEDVRIGSEASERVARIGADGQAKQGEPISSLEAGDGPKMTMIKEKDTHGDDDACASKVTSIQQDKAEDHLAPASQASRELKQHRPKIKPETSSKPASSRMSLAPSQARSGLNSAMMSSSQLAQSVGLVDYGGDGNRSTTRSRTPANEAKEYFEAGGESRTVFLDICKDGIHDYTLCECYLHMVVLFSLSFSQLV